MQSVHQLVLEEFRKFSGIVAFSIIELPLTASQRKYFRITIPSGRSFIGVYHPVVRENRAFLYLSEHFRQYGVSVPEVYYINEQGNIYFQQDLGDRTLFLALQGNVDTSFLLILYERAIEQLFRMQFSGLEYLQFEMCYPVAAFDKQSITWDLNYWKYYFLKISDVHFDEYLLEKDFQTILRYFERSSMLEGFMHRDFQSRNMMLYDNQIWIIDFQGGRRGPVLYDLASCVLDGKANLPSSIREQIIEAYFNLLAQRQNFNRQKAFKHLAACMFIRLIQAFGAYGFRGLIQKMQHFVDSIPFAFQNVRYLRENYPVPFHVPYMFELFDELESRYVQQAAGKSNKLRILVMSFSYRKGIPADTTGHGGGYVFDCRSLPNPGRIPELQQFTGSDEKISEFFSKHAEMKEFIENAYALITQHVKNYLQRGFTSLSVAFGCTGGQHRSVYCANVVAHLLHKEFAGDVEVVVIHRELQG